MKTGIDDRLPFHPLNIAVLTISDTRTEVTDTSGGLLADRSLVGLGGTAREAAEDIERRRSRGARPLLR